MLCSCQSSEKKIEKKDNPRFLSDLSGERYDLLKKEDLRFVYLYGCFFDFSDFGFYISFYLGGLSGAVSGEASERVKGREKKTDVLI